MTHLDIQDFADLLGDTTPQKARRASPRPLARPGRAETAATPESHWPATCGENELAALVGLSPRTVRNLTAEGVIRKTGKGGQAFATLETVQAYLATLRRKSPTPGQADELKAEKIRQAREAADKLALQNAAARRELLPADDVQREWASILADVRAVLLAVPSRAGERLNLSPADVAILTEEIREALEGLSRDTSC